MTLVALAGIARLGSEVLGTFYFARGVGTQVTIFSDLGLSRFVVQRLAKNPQSYGDVFGSLLLMRILLCVLAFLICWSVFAIFPFEVLAVEASLMLSGAFLVFSIADLLLDGLRTREEMHTPVLLTALQRILFTSMTLWGILLGLGLRWILEEKATITDAEDGMGSQDDAHRPGRSKDETA